MLVVEKVWGGSPFRDYHSQVKREQPWYKRSNRVREATEINRSNNRVTEGSRSTARVSKGSKEEGGRNDGVEER